MNVTQTCHIYCRSTTHEEEKTLVIGTITTGNTNITDDLMLPPLNKSRPTSPGGVPNQTTSVISISNISTPTSNDNTNPEHRNEVTTSTNTEEQTATVTMMLILVVVVLMILILLTAATLLLVMWITIRIIKTSEK